MKDASTAGIGGLASVMGDAALSGAGNASAATAGPNAPMLTVMRRDSSASTNSLQIESSTGLLDDLDESDDEGPRGGEKRAGRRKIKIEYIEDKSRRHITFSKRKAGIMKKAYELSTLTGTQVLLLVASETGHVYTFATPKLQPLITKQEGKNLIQACLNSPDHTAIPEYPPSSSANYAPSHGDAIDLPEEDPQRSGSASFAAAMAGLAGYGGYGGMVSGPGTASGSHTPTPHNQCGTSGPSAAAAAAAAAQVFMNPQAAAVQAAQLAAFPYPSNAAFWPGPQGPGASLYGKDHPHASAMQSIRSQSGQSQQQQQHHQQQQQQQHHHQQQQQHQQQQMYQAMAMQQQQMMHQLHQAHAQAHHYQSASVSSTAGSSGRLDLMTSQSPSAANSDAESN